MEEIYKKWGAAEEKQVTGSENKKRKVEMDKASAEEVRLKATEKVSATNKGKNTEEGLVKPKKARRRGWELYNSSVKNLKGIIKFAKKSYAWDRKNMMMRIMQQQNNSTMPLMSKLVTNKQSVYFHELRISNALFNVVFVTYNLFAHYLNLH